ncbi:MAG: AEC family transporter, partial [Candidatus Woesearchaeota archaeon]|nr:AEC family transporter [Candidatus Woesearchaeota archaeon]
PGSEQTVSLVIASSLIVLFGFILAYLEYTKTEKISLGLFRNLIKNPLVLAVLVGFILSMLHFKSPFILDKALTMLASSASPTALVALGIFLIRHIKWDMALMHAVIITAMKLLVLPLIFFLLDRNMAIVVLEAAMPVAVTTFTLAEQYPMKKETVLYAIILSTVFSAITLPMISSFLI